MTHDYWQKQTEEPLFPDILWSRPETKQGAGKLTIIGGNGHGFSAPGIAYNTAMEAGAGVCKVILPDAIYKTVKHLLPDADFVASTPSGSFAKSSLGELLQGAQWSDAVLLAGDIGRNSETAVVLEAFVKKYAGILAVTQDAVDYFKEIPLALMNRQDTLVACSFAQLQRLFIATPTITPITYSMTTQQLVEALHDYTNEHPACIMTKHNDLIFIACGGHVVTHRFEEHMWRVELSAKASVYYMQNPAKPLEAAATSLIQAD